MRENIKKYKKTIKDWYKETDKLSLTVYLILRALVILCMIRETLRGDVINALLCMLSLVLLLMPSIIERRLKISLPNGLEITMYLFVFAAEILGEVNNFYGIIPYWDTILHTLNGFLSAAIGFSIVDLMNEFSSKVTLTPLYLCIVAFCFSMTIGVLWEFFEYTADKLLLFDMQKDRVITQISSVELNPNNENKVVIVDNIDKTIMYNSQGEEIAVVEGGYLDIGLNDTIKDLLVNFIGAMVFCTFGYIYLKKGKKGFIYSFVPVKSRK